MVLVMLAAAMMTVLTACGGSNNDGAAVSESGTKSYNVEMGKPFDVRINNRDQQMQEAKVTIGGFELVSGIARSEEMNEKYDFVKLEFTLENTGDVETENDLLTKYSIKLFGSNGAEIDNGYADIQEGLETYKEAALRPGGKNEGVAYIPVAKGSVIAELVYEDNGFSIARRGNEYVMKVQS